MPRLRRRATVVAGLCAAPALALSTLLPAAPVRAHGIETSLQRLSSLSASLESRFSSGLPAADAAVRLVPPDGGRPIELGRTDAHGRLAFRLPGGVRSNWEVQVDSGPGHRDYLDLGEAGTPAASASPSALRTIRHQVPDQALAWALPLSGLALIGSATAGLIRRRR
jgi:nickel transport protein